MSPRLPGLVLIGCLSLAGAGALAQAEAERRLDVAIERLRAALGPDAKLEIGARRIDPVTGRATLTEVVLTQGDNRMTVPELLLAELEESRIGRAELLRTTFRSDGTNGEIARLVLAGFPIPTAGKTLDLAGLSFAALEVEAARMEDPGRGVMRLGRLAARDWTPQGLGAGTLEEFEYRDAAAEPQVMRLGRVALDAVTLPLTNREFDPLAFRAGRITIENVALRDPEKQVTIALGRIALQDWTAGRPVSLMLEALQLVAPAGDAGQLELSLARFDAVGLDAPNTLAAVMNGVQMPDPFPGTPQRIAVEGLDAAWQGQPVLTLARLAIEGMLADGVAQGALTAEGLRVTPPPGQADWLDALGYREISGGLELRGRAPRAGGLLEIEPMRIAWQEAATLTLAAQVDGVPGAPEAGAPVQPEAAASALAEARLVRATLALRDQGLLGRVLTQQARQQRMPEARLREQWARAAGEGRRGGRPGRRRRPDGADARGDRGLHPPAGHAGDRPASAQGADLHPDGRARCRRSGRGGAAPWPVHPCALRRGCFSPARGVPCEAHGHGVTPAQP